VTHEADWVTVRVFPGSHRDAAIAAMFAAGAEGVQELADSVVTHVHGQRLANSMLCAVLAASADARVDTAPLASIDWSEQWKHGIRAQTLGALTIAPPWLAESLDPARSIIIDTGMAFGTGEHATTRGVVRLMQSVIRPGDRIADLGAGSAVLAIAAVKLGAAHVAAIELDADAIGNAEENVARNGVSGQITVLEGDAATLLPLVAPVRVITANILSLVLLELLPVIVDALAPDGVAILSGILVAERDMMAEAVDAIGWRVDLEDQEDAWWSAAIVRR
jgi:ribosomal protein L11 methyltransferase